MVVAATVIAAMIAVVYVTAAFWVNWWWFGSVGYRAVIVTRYVAQVSSFVVGGAAAGAFLYANLRRALRPPAADRATIAGPLIGRGRGATWVLRSVAAATALVAGAWTAQRWERWLLFVYGRDFGLDDPTFGRDVGFYVFALPALEALRWGATAVVVATGVVTVVVYAIRLGPRFADLRRLPRRVVNHLAFLGGLLLLLIAVGFFFANYRLVYSTRGVVYGPGYTDMTIVRWANVLLALVAVAAAVLLLAPRLRRWRWLLGVAGAWVAVAVLLRGILPSAVQQAFVEPSELRRERAYIARNIAMTRAAFDLDRVERRELSGQGEPSAAELSAQSETFDNVRLWDYRVIRATFQQIRSFVPYYRFVDVDVDRYEVEGRVRQVVVAAREIDVDGLPPNAQTWVNRHLVYTHGYGAVVSPVNEATRQGLPTFLLGGIPPDGEGALAVTRPEIYFGEAETPWVAVNTEETEFTGLQEETEPTPYEGAARGSIGLDSSIRRLVVAAYLGDRRVMLSGDLTGDSRVLLRRGIVERVDAIAPFLEFDPDPYLVVADGRLVWLLDAYTATDRFPGATPIQGLNYVRHAAKVTVDAYDGTTTFYRTEVADPIGDAYAAMYPDLFTPIGEAPATIAAHFRYPERLFDLQAEAFGTYHVEDPTALYNGEDRWGVPQEQVDGEQRRMEAYYVTLRLPEEPASRFGLVLPYVPAGRQDRQNMTAWLAGQTDAGGRSDLVVYRFPRQVTVFGPQQVAARINQDPTIKNQTALLGQAGSRVIRGNMLIIPVGQTVLYVQPLYVQSTETEAAPTELKFVIVATTERVVMRPTLPEALAALSTEQGAEQPPTVEPPPADPAAEPAAAPGDDPTELAAQALAAYERGQAALRDGDWATYGREQAVLEDLLRRLAGEPAAEGSPAGTPSP